MKLKTIVFLLAMLLVALSAQLSWAQIPQTMSCQGFLQENGVVVSDGFYDLVFRFYADETGGIPLWEETHNGVEVVGGIFDVVLGSVNPAGNPLDLPFDQQYWLGVKIGAGGVEQVPRLQLTSSAYSLGGSFWRLNGNSDTNPTTNFLGTTDNIALELRANNSRVLRLEPHSTSPNIIGGLSGNWINSGVYGATIGGGGTSASGYFNSITDSYGTVAGGYANRAGNAGGTTDDALGATVGGGFANRATGEYATIAGGYNNACGQ